MKEYGCMYGLMNGADSDNAISIQKMVTLNMQHCSETSIKLGPGHCTRKASAKYLNKQCFGCVRVHIEAKIPTQIWVSVYSPGPN